MLGTADVHDEGAPMELPQMVCRRCGRSLGFSGRTKARGDDIQWGNDRCALLEEEGVGGGGGVDRVSLYGVRLMPVTPLSAQGRAPAMMEAGGGGKGSGRSRLGRQVGVYLARQGAFSVRSGWCAGGRGREGG